jgi:hypothetical protein
MIGRAKERIPYRALVLCRGGIVQLAGPELANGVAMVGWPGTYHELGDYLAVEPVKGLGQRDLHAMANGPIMDPIRLFLPAGKLNNAQYQERLRGIIDESQIVGKD